MLNAKTRWIASAFLAAGLACLSACGGGGGSSSSGSPIVANASLSGSAVDAPIANAQITITSGAPLHVAGALSIGSIVAHSSGNFTVSIALPTATLPIFANALDPHNTTVVLSSYLGQSSALLAAGTLSSNNLPNLDISPVTTAALAVYAQLNGGSYSSLTPSSYATVLRTYRSDILAIAAAIKAVGDQLCQPANPPSSTSNLAARIAAGANLSSGSPTTLQTAAAQLGGNCPAVLASLPQMIEADEKFGPELELGDVIDAGVQSLPAGSYQLQGLIAETGMRSSQTSTTASFVAASVFTDSSVTVGSAGQIISADGKVSGLVMGNLLTLSVQNGSQSYSLRGKVGALPAALSTGGQAYAIRSAGSNSATQVLSTFQAVLAPQGAMPVWNGLAAPTNPNSQHGVACAAGTFPLRLDAFGKQIGGSSLAECITPNAQGWSMVAASTTLADFDFDRLPSRSTSSNNTATLTVTVPSLTAPVWREVSATNAPFVISATNASYSRLGVATSGNTYYVMGAHSIVFASTSANNLLSIHSNAFTQIFESGKHSADKGESQGDDH